MAGDAKSTPSPGHNSRGSVTNKIREVDGWLVGMAGCFSLFEVAADRLKKALASGRPPPTMLLDMSDLIKDSRGDQGDDIFLLLWHPKYGAYHCETTTGGHVLANSVQGDFFAIGSGSQLALAAMMAGAGPERAVEIACELDPSSGRPVNSINL